MPRQRAQLHSCPTPPLALEVVGLCLAVGPNPSGVCRFELTLDDAEQVGLALLQAAGYQRFRAGVHSVMSCGSPSVDGSTVEGQ